MGWITIERKRNEACDRFDRCLKTLNTQQCFSCPILRYNFTGGPETRSYLRNETTVQTIRANASTIVLFIVLRFLYIFKTATI